jgi:phage-related protein
MPYIDYSIGLQRRKLVTADLYWVGAAKKELQKCPEVIKKRIGYQLLRLQNGAQPDDFKPMPSVGKGVYEIRVADEQGNNTGRCFYVAKVHGGIYVLHAFVKKSQRTPKLNLEMGKERFRELQAHLRIK